MRTNPVKQQLAAGCHAFGSMIFEFFTPGMPRLLKNAGAEYAMYCMEHTGASYETLKPQFALCRALGVVPLVLATGAGAAARQSMGSGVFGGMIVATFVAPIFIPLFFSLLARKARPSHGHPPPNLHPSEKHE